MGSVLHSSNLNGISPYTIFPTTSSTFESTTIPPTEKYIFDSGATDTFYQPSIPVIHAIEPDGSTFASAGEKTILLQDTNDAIQQAADGHILPNLWHHSILSMGCFWDAG